MTIDTEAQRDLATIMNTLGQLAGAVWPLGIPRGVRITLLSEPHRGFDMMVSHADFTAHRDPTTLVKLASAMPAWFCSNVRVRGITEEHHRHFWNGFTEQVSTSANDIHPQEQRSHERGSLRER